MPYHTCIALAYCTQKTNIFACVLESDDNGTDDENDVDVNTEVSADNDDESPTTNTIDPKPNRYYMVSFCTVNSTGSKTAVKYYVGMMLKSGTVPLHNEFNFRFMRYSKTGANKFIWPNVQDEAVVPLEDVKLELSPPTSGRHSELIFSQSELSPYMKWIC